MVVGETGAVISQKQEGRLCLVQPSVDLQSNTLTLSYPGELGHVLGLPCSGVHTGVAVYPRTLT